MYFIRFEEESRMYNYIYLEIKILIINYLLISNYYIFSNNYSDHLIFKKVGPKYIVDVTRPTAQFFAAECLKPFYCFVSLAIFDSFM